jgi:predicted DNA-binding transcriptional regulator YafY
MARGDQLARQWMIFQKLIASRYGKTVNDLAADLECHPRTVYRDLDALQAAGFPIYNERVNGTGFWALMESARQPVPVPFSLPELMALYFGRDVLKVLRDTLFHDALESLFKKIKATLPADAVKYLKQIEGSLQAGTKPYKQYGRFKEILETLNRAVIEKKVVEISYYTMSRKKMTRRQVEPYKLWFFDGTFYLIGRCRRKDDVRIFAVDRIKMLDLIEESFKIPADFNLDDFMNSSFGVFQGKPQTVKIWFSAEAAEYVKEKTWHESQQIRKQRDGSIIFEAQVAGTAEIKLWILRWGARAVVLEPDKLRDDIQSEAADMLAVYANGTRQLKKALTA